MAAYLRAEETFPVDKKLLMIAVIEGHKTVSKPQWAWDQEGMLI